MIFRFFTLLTLLSLPTFASADYINTHDGSHLTGVIKQVTPDAIIMATEYAGDITIQRAKVLNFATEQALSTRLQDGTTTTSKIRALSNGMLSLSSTQTPTAANDIVESWQPNQTDPEVLRQEKIRKDNLRKWSYAAGVDITGKKGNSDESSVAINVVTKLKGKQDVLKLYGSLDQAEQDGEDNSDETILGFEYTNYIYQPWGWYVRSEFEQDDFEDIDLRTLLGAGLSYRAINTPDHSLAFRSGLGYRHEKFTDGTKEQSPTLDLGLDHDWKIANWLRINNELTYTPAIDDFNDYLITHDSGLIIPLGNSEQWQLRLGLKNDYKSLPSAGNDHLDTSYYSRLRLSWD